jgi:hypothetical protein
MDLKRGDKFVVLPGMQILSTNPASREKIAKRRFTVTVAYCIKREDGRIDVNWAGSSGYWRWVTIKKESA